MHKESCFSGPFSSEFSFRQLLPVSIFAVEDAVGRVSGALGEAEAAAVAGAGQKRRSEFTAGRSLAREGLAALGVPAGELLADAQGAPIWPAAVTGCITHAAGRIAVAIALRTQAQALGIDMEAVTRFHRGLEAQVLTDHEIRTQLAVGSDAERQARNAVLFCAKEAWFKCQFPIARRRLGFLDAQVEVDWDSGRFVVRPHGATDTRAAIPGRAGVHEGIARAAIVLAPGALSAEARRAWHWPAVN